MKLRKEIQTTRHVVTMCKCDRCGKPVKHADNSDWSQNEVILQATLGEVYPEGDFRKVTRTDSCPECWLVAKEALQSAGFVFREHDADEEDPGQ